MKVVYVAAIYSTGNPTKKVMKERMKNASRYCIEIAKMGAIPHSPLHDTSWDWTEKDFLWEDFIHMDLTKVRRLCDAAFFTPEWEKSDGCRVEHIFCKKLGIPIFYSLPQLERWLCRTWKKRKDAPLTLI